MSGTVLSSVLSRRDTLLLDRVGRARKGIACLRVTSFDRYP